MVDECSDYHEVDRHKVYPKIPPIADPYSLEKRGTDRSPTFWTWWPIAVVVVLMGEVVTASFLYLLFT